MKEYLTEKKLGLILNDIFKEEFINNKKVPNSSILNRPDFRSDILKLIVEFDGYFHYTSSKVILNDINKDNEYKKLGYEIIHIPYFIQISSNIIFNLFNVNYEYKQQYPHGFIDEKVIFPADFCEMGIDRFKNDLIKFYYVKNEIIKSLINKIEIMNINLILPSSLFYLIKENII